MMAVLGVFLRDWPFRAASLLVPVVSAAGVTFILTSILAISNGISDAMRRGGTDDGAIVLHRDTQIEMSSRLSDDDVAAIASALNEIPAQRDERVRVVSPELVQTLETNSRGAEAGAQVLARGISTAGIRLHEQFRILEGRLFTAGKLEVIVGRRLARDFAGLSLGTSLASLTGDVQGWTIVGVFEDGGGTAESEVWMDLDSARTESGSRQPVSSLRVRPLAGSDLNTLREAVRRSPQLQVQIVTERELQARQFSQSAERARLFGIGLALLLCIGAIVASVNTMSAAITARMRSVATLRALGFTPSATVIAVFAEAMILGLLGGVLGATAAFLVADGYGLSVLNGATSTPLALSATVTWASLVQGISLAALLTVLAAVVPCVSIARISVVSALNNR